MQKLLPFLLCLACAPASSPGTYAKGTYRPPVRAPTFSPSEDAPHTFEPGRPAPVQPGPIPARVLPQTPETRKGPGIWAGDEPKASDEDPDSSHLVPHAPVHLGGVLLPFVEPTETKADTFITYMCSNMIPRTGRRMGISLKKPWNDRALYECVVADLFKDCVTYLTSQVANALSNDAKRFEQLRAKARALREQKCPGDLGDKAIRSWGGPPEWRTGESGPPTKEMP
jgi:hypothetical protein